MLLTEIPWAAAIWALPFLTVLSPSERYYQTQGRAPQKLTERAWQIIQQQERNFLLPLDAALYDPAPLRRAHQKGRKNIILLTPLKGKRRPTPEQVLANPKTKWKKLEIEDW
jgi:hypothetical protein